MSELRLLDLVTVHERYGINLRTLRKYASEGRIPVVHLGRRVYVNPSAFEAFLRAQSKPARAA